MSGFTEVPLSDGGLAFIPKRPEWRRVKAIQQEYNAALPPRGFYPPPIFRDTLGRLRASLEKGQMTDATVHLAALEKMVTEARGDFTREELVTTVNSQLESDSRALAHMVHHWDGVHSPETGALIEYQDDMPYATRLAAVDKLNQNDHRTLLLAAIAAWRGASGATPPEGVDDPNTGAGSSSTSQPASPSPTE